MISLTSKDNILNSLQLINLLSKFKANENQIDKDIYVIDIPFSEDNPYVFYNKDYLSKYINSYTKELDVTKNTFFKLGDIFVSNDLDTFHLQNQSNELENIINKLIEVKSEVYDMLCDSVFQNVIVNKPQQQEVETLLLKEEYKQLENYFFQKNINFTKEDILHSKENIELQLVKSQIVELEDIELS